MATKNFAQKVWEARLIENFHEVSVADLITTPPTSMTGSSIVFNKVNAGVLNDYAGTVSWADVDTTPIEMTPDFKKYFAFALDDVDKAQTNLAVVDATTKEHSASAAEAGDTYVLGKAIDNATIKIGSKTTTKTITTPNEAYNYIVDLGTELGKKKVPISDRYVIIDNAFLNLLQKDSRFTLNANVLANGIVQGQKINGMQVVVSESKPANAVIALHKSAMGWGKQIDEIEAMRLESKFADGVRGLIVGGGTILNSDALAVLYYTISLA